jgi:hypothetical protein
MPRCPVIERTERIVNIMQRTKKRILIFLLLWPVLAGLIGYYSGTNAFVSVFLFFGIPSVVLSIGLSDRLLRKLGLFSVVVAPITIVAIDYIAHVNGQWLVPHSILPWRYLGQVTVEVVFWAILQVFVVLAFYEYFLDRGTERTMLHPRMRAIALILFAATVAFTIAYVATGGAIQFPFAYLILCLALIALPLLLVLAWRPGLSGKFLITGAYFFYLTFAYEIAALHSDWWRFPGEFIGWVSVAGVGFPLEEFLFWFVLLAMAILAWYEYFDDDGR